MQKHKNLRKQGNMTPAKVNNITVMDSNNKLDKIPEKYFKE
jgi:hypothetical protein